jgi:hypothetical protein
MSLELRCLERGYSLSNPIKNKDLLVAFKDDYAIIFTKGNTKDLEDYYKQSYPHIKYYVRKVKELI